MRWRVAAKALDGEANGRERILELVCDLARSLPKRGGALGLECPGPTELELARHAAHTGAQGLKFGSSPAHGGFGQCLAAGDMLRPSHELLQWTTQMAAQMAGDAERAQAEK